MTSALNVAEHILIEHGPMTGLKLQKLVYYAQAWHLVWKEQPLFDDPIEGWINGPVVRKLWERHQGQPLVKTVGGAASELTDPQRDVVDKVLALYGHRPSEFLSSLTHEEYPWKRSRRGLAADDRGTKHIAHEWIASYYEQAHPGGEGMDLDMTAQDVEDMLEGEEQLERGEFVTLDDLESGVQGQTV